MLLSAVKFLIGGVSALLVWSVGAIDSNSTFTVYNLVLITVLVGGGVTYVLLQVRDYKPNRRLRDDNANLRHDNDDLLARLDTAENEVKDLKKSRDFEQVFAGLLAAIAQSRDATAQENKEVLTAIRDIAEAIRTGDRRTNGS